VNKLVSELHQSLHLAKRRRAGAHEPQRGDGADERTDGKGEVLRSADPRLNVRPSARSQRTAVGDSGVGSLDPDLPARSGGGIVIAGALAVRLVDWQVTWWPLTRCVRAGSLSIEVEDAPVECHVRMRRRADTI